MEMKEHLFVSECDGALHDTREPNWAAHPLRANFCRTHARIKTAADYKATLRAGAYAWPGGYPMYLVTQDGAALCFDCGRSEIRNILDDILSKRSTGWRVIGVDVNYEDSDLYCDHCDKHIESAYGNDDSDD